MNRKRVRSLYCLLVAIGIAPSGAVVSQSAAADQPAHKNWPQWRGPLANGVAPLGDPPLSWSETSNVKWKVKIPGGGSSTPVVWENRVFVQTAIPTGKKVERPAASPPAADPPPAEGNPGQRRGRGFGRGETPTEFHQFAVLCLDRQTGKTVWQKVAREEVPHEGHQPSNTYASASPVTDGQVVVAFFGSRGLYCYDLNGNLKWEKDFGDMRTANGFGEGASPALYGNTVVVQWDHEGDDFIAALDKNTGTELWRQARDERTTWSTPFVVEHEGKPQVVTTATQKTRSYDLASGKEIWTGPALTANAIPSAVAADGIVYLMSGFRGNALYAIKLGRAGDLTGTDAIIWSHNKSTPYVPSPLLIDGLLYFVSNNNGILSCFDAKTGQPHFEAERFEAIRGIYASPVAAKDRVYVLGREGTCLVLKKGPKLEVLATNTVEDRTDASIALAGKELFIRGNQNLYCIAEL